MYISTKDWKNYIDRLSMLDKKAADAMLLYVQQYGFADRDKLISFANSVVQKYGTGSAALAAAMYDAVAEMSGQFYDPAEPAPLPEYGEVAKTVNGTLKRSQNPHTLAGAVSRLVKKAGIDTTLQNAYRDGPAYDGTDSSRASKRSKKRRHSGAQVAWVPHGDTCPFCLMLASRGWMNQTNDGAENHAEHIHANCDCTYAVRFDNHSGVAGYDPDEYYDMFQKYDGTWGDKINAMRRDQYQENKEEINAQKKAAYVERQSKSMDYKLVNRDTDKTETVQSKEGNISISPLIDSKNGLFISDSAKLKPKELHIFEQQVEFAKKVTKLSDGQLPRFVIVADTDLSSRTGGRFDSDTNTVFLKKMEDKDLQKHVVVHEIFHAKDFQDYIAKGGIYKSKDAFIDEICKISKKKLDKLGINEHNVGEISNYAFLAFQNQRFDEVLTEYRTKKALGGV